MGLWLGTLYCIGTGRRVDGCLDGPELNMFGRKVSFSSRPILEPILNNLLVSSLAFWGAVGGITGVSARCAGF